MLKFTGIGAAFCPSLGNTSAYVLRGNELVLLDCGGTVFAALHQAGLLEGLEKITCIISHRHADHTGSLGTLVSYAKHVAHFQVTLVHPEAALGELMTLNGIGCKDYDLAVGDHYEADGLKVRFYPVTHTASLPAWGFTLTLDGETIYYSGDGEKVPDTVWADFLAGRIRYVYQDCGRTPHKGHGDLTALMDQTPRELRSRIYPIHWDEDYREAIRQAGFSLAF